MLGSTVKLTLLGFGLALGVRLTASPVFAADLATIRDRGYVVVAVREAHRPLSFRDPQGDLVGLEIDVARRLAEALFADSEAVEFVVVDNADRLPAVLEGRVDLAIAGLTLTAARQRLVSFSLPYYLDGTGILVRDPQIQSLQGMHQRRIGVLDGSSSVPLVRYLLPLARLTSLTSYRQAFEQLSRGQIDGFAGDITMLTGWQQNYSDYYLIPQPLSAEPLAIALPKGTQYTDLQSLVNQTISEGHATGWLEDRSNRWGLP
jgi:polar amino acid transport system substrate-binding protein